MQKPVALVFALLLAFGAIAVVPSAGAAPIITTSLQSTTGTDGSPTTGDTNGGEIVTIEGTGFSSDPEVTVGGIPAEVSAVRQGSPDEIDIIIPTRSANQTGAVAVVVDNNDGTGSFTRSNAYTYSKAEAPVVTGITTNSGPSTGGPTELTIFGAEFADLETRPTVTFGGVPGILGISSDDELTVRPPANVVGQAPLVVSNPDGQKFTLGTPFTVSAAPAPSITSLTPSNGGSNAAEFEAPGGSCATACVRIKGNNFVAGATVQFGGVPARHVQLSGIDLLVVPPPHAPGTVAVVVQNPDGLSQTKTGAFTYNEDDKPALNNPAEPILSGNSGGTLVCLESSDESTLVSTEDVPGTTVTVGGLAAYDVEVLPPDADCTGGDDVLSFRTPSGLADGTYSAVVKNPDGQTDTVSNVVTFRVVFAALGVTSGTSGSCNGGTAVVIEGLGLLAGSHVFFGTVPAAAATVSSATALTATSPANDCDAPASNVDIVVVAPNGKTSTLHGAFDYTSTTTPAITVGATGLAPSSGPTNGGTEVTIKGTGFGARRGTVTFDGTEGNITSWSDTQVKVKTPSTEELLLVASDDVDVVLTTAGGQDATREDGFNYTTSTDPSCAATCLAPATNTENGGVKIAIQGAGFSNGYDEDGSFPPTVTVGGAPATVTSVTANKVEFTSPPRATDGTVLLVNPNGEDLDAGTLDYQPAPTPTVTSITSGAGTDTTLGRKTITVTGTGFATGLIKPVVCFGGTTATEDADCADAGEAPGTNVVVATNGNSLTVATPGHTAGAKIVRVINPIGEVSANDAVTYAYTLGGAPVITSIEHSSGALNQDPIACDPDEPVTAKRCGQILKITGSNFATRLDGTLPVTFGSTVVTNVTVDALGQQLTVRVPDRTTLPTINPVDINVTNVDGQSGAFAEGFRYLPVAPTISTVSVTGGSANGGTTVTVTAPAGTFDDQETAAFMDRVPVRDQVVTSATSLSFKSPKGAGLQEVAVTDGFGQSAVTAPHGPLGFAYEPALKPTVSRLLPASGPSLGGSLVCVDGVGIAKDAKVTVGGIAATDVKVYETPAEDGACETLLGAGALLNVVGDRWDLSFRTPSVVKGAQTVVVTNPDGQAATLTGAFTSLGEGGSTVTTLSITSVNPPQGLPAGNTTVTITGTKFADGASVTFGTAAATNVSVVSPTQITAKTPPHALGPVDVTVTIGTETFTKPLAFTYTNTPVDPDPDPNDPDDTDTDTDSETTGPTPLTAATIENTNLRIKVTVTREGDTNIISWDLPTPPLGHEVAGIQIWRSNSPYTLIQDIPESDSDFGDTGEYRDSSDEAKAESKYLVTMYYGLSAALGQFLDGHDFDEDDYEGVSSVDGEPEDTGGSVLPTWAIVLIALGILFLVVLVAVLIARGRNRDGQQAAAQGYAWQEEGEAKAAEGEWQPPAEVHQARCPACATSFTATGQKPIVTVCPGCGKKGILR